MLVESIELVLIIGHGFRLCILGLRVDPTTATNFLKMPKMNKTVEFFEWMLHFLINLGIL